MVKENWKSVKEVPMFSLLGEKRRVNKNVHRWGVEFLLRSPCHHFDLPFPSGIPIPVFRPPSAELR